MIIYYFKYEESIYAKHKLQSSNKKGKGNWPSQPLRAYLEDEFSPFCPLGLLELLQCLGGGVERDRSIENQFCV